MSEIRANTVSNAAGTGPVTLTGQSAAKAWATFNGATSPITLYDSFNTSSISDGGAGRYTVNFSSSFSVGNNICVASSSNWRGIVCPDAWNAGNVLLLTAENTGTSPSDRGRVAATFDGDLA